MNITKIIKVRSTSPFQEGKGKLPVLGNSNNEKV